MSIRDRIGGGDPPKGGVIFGLKWRIFGAEGAENVAFFGAAGAKNLLKWHISGAAGAKIFRNFRIFLKFRPF